MPVLRSHLLAQQTISVVSRTSFGGRMERNKLQFLLFFLTLLFCFACNKPSDDAVSSIKAKSYSEPLLKSASVDLTAKGDPCLVVYKKP
jgi:hypothetical protein